jgi:hypothetical protein
MRSPVHAIENLQFIATPQPVPRDIGCAIPLGVEA